MLNKKLKNSNAAAKITSATLESNNLITYFTQDSHGLFVGGIVSVSGVTGGPTGATQPNPVVSNVYRVDNPNSFTVYVSTSYTATSFPVTFSSSGTVQVAQGALNAVTLSYAQPIKVARPTFFNYISPTITATASGNRVLLSWNASGIAYPTPTVTVGRYDSTGTTLLGAVSTAATGSSVIDPSGTNLTNGTVYVYKVSASNTASTVNASTSVTSLFVNTPASITASATANAANSINVTWSPAVTNAVLTSYTIQRSTNGGAFATAYATTSGTVTSFTDTGLTQTSNYKYKVLANADYTSAGTGIIVSGVSATSATITPYFISTVTPTATVTASTANSITVTWSAPVTSNPAVSGYSLQRSSDGGSTWSANLVSTTSTATTYVDTAALSGLTYTYRLAAINSQLTSAYTSSGTATAYYLNEPLNAPIVTNLSASSSSLIINGSYTANPSITGYVIRRSSDNGSTWSNVGATNYSITLPYTDTTPVSGTNYVYAVKATNGQLTNINFSANSAAVGAYSVPNPPTTVSAAQTPGTTNINVSWSGASVIGSSPAITSYLVETSSTGTSSWSTVVTTTATSIVATGSSTAVATYYRISAINSVGTGSASTVTQASFVNSVSPTASATASTANSISVSWSAPTSFPTLSSYTLQESTSTDNTTWSAWATVQSSNATSYVKTAAINDIYYRYQVAAITSAQTGVYGTASSGVQPYFLSDPIAAPVASNSSTSTTSITVTGTYTANPAISGFNIQRAIAGTSPTFASVGATNYSITLPYVDTTVSANTSYLYQLKTKNAQLTTANWSASSNSILSYSVPFNPTSVNASSINATQVTVTWSGASVNSTNTPITSYTLGYKLSSTTTYTTLTGISGSSYTVSGLTTDSAYDFRILAVNGIGTSTTTGAIVTTATPVRVADTSISLAAYNGSTPYFNTSQSFTAVATVGRSVTVQISSDNSNWSDLSTYTSAGTNYPSWTADTTSIRYFRLVVAQDSTYTQTISNTVTIDPINNYLSVSLYSDFYNDYSTQTTVVGTATVVVTVSDVYGTPVVGATVSWKGVQFPASSYTTRVTNTTDSNGRATLTLSSASPALDLTTSFEFQIDATKTNYDSALSKTLETYYTIFVSETDTAHANIARSYAGSNAVRTGQGTDLYYGYFDTTWDTQKSAMGFTTFPSWAKLDASAEVISATLRLTRGSSSGSNPGTLYIGTHENGSGASSNWDTYGETAFGNISTRLQSHSISYSETNTITLNSTILATLFAGGVRGFTIGPPTSTNILYYGKVEGVGAGSTIDPVFTVTYTVVPTFNVP